VALYCIQMLLFYPLAKIAELDRSLFNWLLFVKTLLE
jgi:hypothetical protein